MAAAVKPSETQDFLSLPGSAFKQDLFEPGKFFEQCHAAYITEIPSKTLVVTFFGGTREKARDVGSWITRKHPRDGTWHEPRLFLKDPKKSTGSAHLFVPPGKKEVWMFYNLMHGGGWSTCNQPLAVYTPGTGWNSAGYLRRMIGWCTRGKMHVLDDGRYIAPMHDELLGYKAYFLVSVDQGKHWKVTGPVKTKKGCLEPTIAQLGDGRLLCMLRTKEREIFQAWSLDRGSTWTRAEPTGIPSPDSMVELLAMPSGELVLAYNHSTERRSPLCVRYSTNGARTWSTPVIVASGEGEFSYPCMVLGSDGYLHLVYTNNRRTIGYVRFMLGELFGATQ